MKLSIKQISLGPLETNAVLILDEENKQAIVVDPSFNPEPLATWAENEGIEIVQIWITHGHADHTAGVPALMRALPKPADLLMSAEAYAMVQKQGTEFFGFPLEPFPKPTRFIQHGEKLGFGENAEIAEARFAPGHAPGSVVYYLADAGVAIVGDVIFRAGIGRWDFEGGNFKVLTQSIQEQVFTLPDETILLPGHGPNTTVGWEKKHNPYLS